MRIEQLIDKTVPVPFSGCFVFMGSLDDSGYGRVKVNGKAVRAHRLAYELSNGPIPAGLLVCHTCDTPSCVNPAHLFLGTHQENWKDAFRKNRASPLPSTFQVGEQCHAAKLTEADVVAIRESSLSSYEAARLYGVSARSIRDIRSRLTWKHVAPATQTRE